MSGHSSQKQKIHTLVGDDATYVDITARDADTNFNTNPDNINKKVRVDSPGSYYMLFSVTGDPSVDFIETSNTGVDEFLDLTDTFPDYTALAGGVLQVNAAETGIEAGQPLRTIDSPTFDQVTVGNSGLVVGLSTPFLDAVGVLTLQNVNFIDATTEATLEAAIDELPNLISIQSQTISLSGPLTVEASSVLNQDLTTDADPTFRDPTFRNLVLTGDLTVQGLTTTLDVQTLLVEDKNIELGNVATPTNVTADGGGLILKSSPDITILWRNAKNAWEFNQSIDLLGNSIVDGGTIIAARAFFNNFGFDNNEIFSLTGDLDVTTFTGGVFKFDFQAFRAGLDASNYLEIGHGGSNSFVNQVGVGGMDFRFGGVTKATFTPAGHLHLQTDVDQRDILKLKTVNNLNDTGIAWEDSFGLFTHTIFRTDTGNNRAGLVFAAGQDANVNLLTNSFIVHGATGVEGKLEVLGVFQVSSGGPGAGKVLNSDAVGITSWVSPAWSDDGTVVRLTTVTDKVGIGEPLPDTKLHVADGTAGVITALSGTIATFESPGDGFLSILTPDASTRGILFGSPSSNLAGGIFYNDPGSPDGFQFRVNGGVTKMVIEGDGRAAFGTTNPDLTALLELKSTTKGFLPPRMTTAEIDAIAFPATGLESYDTTINKKKVFTGAEFKTFLTEDLGNVITQETFASTNARFFGELALPATQGWTDTATGSATIDLFADTVFGESKQVVRHNDDVTNGSTTSLIALTLQNWTDINDFGASFSGISRLDTINGAAGFFVGLQADAAENPLATGNRRYGLTFADVLGNLKITEPSGTTITFDGTGGTPLVASDEYFSWECVVPAGLGAAEFYINSILTTFAPTFITNAGGLGTSIRVSSGSTSGTNRITYHDNFGVTIFEESSTKTLAAATMVGDVVQINIPEGKRDYTIILPDGNPRAIGVVLRLVANNVLGLISLENQNPAAPEILYNGLRTLVINIAVKEIREGINTVNSGNVYLGFQTGDIDFKAIGSVVVGGNTTATVISTINTFVDLDLGTPGVVEEGNIERFTLTNSTTGEIRYDGNKPISLILNGLLAAISAGGSQRFNFRLLKNGSPLPSPDNVDIPIEIGTELSSVPIHWPIKAVTGDLFRLQVENADGTSNITIDTLKFAMV